MNNTPTPPRPRFEDRLLDELKAVVANAEVSRLADAVPAAEPIAAFGDRGPGRRPRRRLAYGLAASAVVASSLGLAVPPLFGGGSAEAAPYTVVTQPDGGIRFTIDEFRDPQGLEARFRQLGANVKVDYVPLGKQCAAGRFVEHPLSEADMEALVHWVKPPTDRLMTDAEIDYYREAWQEIRPERIPPGTTLVLTMGIYQNPDDDEERTAGGSTHLADGPVGACQLVDGGQGIGPIVREDGSLSAGPGGP